MNERQSNRSAFWLIGLIVLGTIYAAGLIHGRYLGKGWPFAKESGPASKNSHDEHDHSDDAASHDHGEHSHEHSDENSLELSDTARKNLGLTEEFLQPIELKSFERSLTVPAIVAEVPGRTRLPVSAPMTGVITHVHAVAGEAIHSGDLILEMRLTHEDLVTAQKDYLQSLGELDIEEKEIARLEPSVTAGVIAPKTLLERQYNRDKVESALRSQREALRLHGLTESQISMIDSQRKLLTEIRVVAPNPDDHSEEEIRLSQEPLGNVSQIRSPFPSPRIHFQGEQANAVQQANFAVPSNHADKHLLVLQELLAQKGQIVTAGDMLCKLADYEVLLIEGQSFENEASQIIQAKSNGWNVTGLIEEAGQLKRIENLRFEWIDNEINPMTRALRFYVALPNELVHDSTNANKQRHVSWKYRVGQRMQLQVPIEKWEEQIVLPVDAVVREGIESYVFQQNGDHFDRVAVHEYFRDQISVVIENDGSLYPGDVVALRGAHQLLMALKNKSGGGADPHAGHNH